MSLTPDKSKSTVAGLLFKLFWNVHLCAAGSVSFNVAYFVRDRVSFSHLINYLYFLAFFSMLLMA